MPLILSGTAGVSQVNGTAAAPAITGTDTDTGVFFGTNTVSISTGGTERLQVDTSGNLGLGVTPSAWASGWKVLQLADSSISNNAANDTYVGANFYFDGTNTKYINSSFASYYGQVNGQHQFFTAASGTAGATATFTQAMTLDASGNLGVGSTSPNIGGLTRALTLNTPTGGNYSGVELAGAGTLSARFITNNAAGTFIGSQVSIPLIFETNATERARIDSSGNLGIGLTSPSYKLDVAGSARITAGGSADTILGYGANYDNYFTSGASGIQVFRNSSGAERARIDSSGNLLVGTTSNPATGKLAIAGNNGVTGSAIAVTNQSGTSQYYAAAFYNNGNSVSYCGSISISGTTTQYATSSDYRLKENIVPMTGALATIAQLKPCTYSWKSTGESTQGFIAHELQKVVPECVIGEKDAVDEDGNPVYQGIDTSFLVATLTAAIKEQQAIIDQLKSRLDAANL